MHLIIRLSRHSNHVEIIKSELKRILTTCDIYTLLKAARIRNDKHILLQIESQDSIALKIKYHRSCYKDYVRQETLNKFDNRKFQTENFTSNTAHQDAFEQIKEHVIA